MLKLFEICFYTGIVFTVISFFLGEIFNVLHFDFPNLPFHADLPDAVVSPLRPSIIAAFITTFGGVGLYCLRTGKPNAFALGVALVIALPVAFIFYRCLIVPLSKAQNTSTPKLEQLYGLTAKMSLGIKGDSFGEIMYTINGNSFCSPCKSLHGEDIAAGTDVIIIEIREGVFFVFPAPENQNVCSLNEISKP